MQSKSKNLYEKSSLPRAGFIAFDRAVREKETEREREYKFPTKFLIISVERMKCN